MKNFVIDEGKPFDVTIREVLSSLKKEGLSSQKMFISLNQLKEYCNVQNQSI